MKHLINKIYLMHSSIKKIKRGFYVAISLLISISMHSQQSGYSSAKEILHERGEVYFSFSANDDIAESYKVHLTRLLSIDKISDGKVWAYANEKTFDQFVELGIDYKILTPPSMLHKPKMIDEYGWRNQNDWDYYPTYEAYVDILNQFAIDYPELCEVVSIETLASGREILLVHINDSLGVDQPEPEFLYTSSMHGDETAGYVLTLHFIDYLLSNYGTDNRITDFVENIDIWLNPLANPDGTYAGGNSTVFGAKRFNANNVDLNRNYPDPEDGTNPDGNPHQPETIAFMDFAEEHDFVLSANMHGGAEVCNYPWDTWSTRHADTDWWEYVCRQYADTAHLHGPAGYMTDLDNGVTNGYDWYSISGGRQDYMTYFQNGREFTLEMSTQKLIPENQFLIFWESNYRSLLNYLGQVLFGVKGIVTDSNTGEPIAAMVFIEDHDKDNSEIYAAENLGDYHRTLKGGNYDISFSHPGYRTKTLADISVTDEDVTILNVALDPVEVYTMHDTSVYVCDAIFYDSGGPDENYGDNEDITMTFISYLESGELKATFREFELEESDDCQFDYLEIFDGKDTLAPLIGKWCGTDNPGSIVAHNIDGALTFRFHSNAMINDAGWKAELNCDTSVGIKEKENSYIILFPNPSKDFIFIQLNAEAEWASIHDLSGIRLQNLTPNSKKFRIELTGLKPGIYFIKVSSNNQIYSQKFVKQ